MVIHNLYTINPIDGRYFEKTEELRKYFSEFALIKYRVLVEIEYFISLYELSLPQLANIDKSIISSLHDIYMNFSEEDALEIKNIEKVTNHDVKAVEYFLKDKFEKLHLSQYKEFIHFGLTSQDINNTAIPLSIKDCMLNVYIPMLEDIINILNLKSQEWKDIAMLSRTHGQAATPTSLGKEILVFVERIKVQKQQLINIPINAKFGGATGSFNAHNVAYPQYNWHKFADNFVNNKLGLMRSNPTTQIEHYDNIAALLQCIERINTILIDFARDIWTYISLDYFKQQISKNEVGSSAMPHKVNPIDFENAEGNFGIANAIAAHLSAKLPISRLQRDLTDSTVLRNIGTPFAHTIIAFKSLKKGISKLLLNQIKINKDLEDNWIIIAEAIQTILRRENYPNPYEVIKEITRTNEKVDKHTFINFIDKLNLSNDVKDELKAITPFNYLGQQ